MYRITIDVGGTFTDCLVLDEDRGELRQFKSPTTPDDPSIGFLNALTKAATGYGHALDGFLKQVELIIHGTTLATNTLINRNGAKTGMITTEGFRDIIEIRRGYKNVRTSMYNVFVPPYEPLVPRYLRREAKERILFSGDVHTALSDEDVDRAAQALKDEDVESVAIGFLHAYANPDHERRATDIAAKVLGDTYITSSHEILPVWREWERFSTTVVSAYCGPVVQRYLNALRTRLADAGFGGHLLLMLSDGLVETVDYCIPRVVYLIGSGPAAAPSGALFVGQLVGDRRNLLSVDMGGTSFDICMVRDGEIPTTTDGWIVDERIAIKMVDIQTGGAGGGSIAWVDSLGLLRVGPQSAGSEPGPACYGHGGTRPTVTDADVLLGYVPADFFLGGEIPLYLDRAEEAMRTIAEPLGMDVTDAAEAVFTTVNSFMADMITEVSTRRGHDVRDFTLVAGGGAGPIHAAFIADRLGIGEVIIPSTAATYSAFGMFAMDVGRNYARSYIARSGDIDLDRVNELYAEMEAEAVEGFKELDVPADQVEFSRTADMRYVGQFHEVEVMIPDGHLEGQHVEQSLDNFHARHERLYTFKMPFQRVEFLTFRLRATAPKAPFELRHVEAGVTDPSAAMKRRRSCRFAGSDVDTPVYDGDKLMANNIIEGPAVIEERTTTVIIPPSYDCTVSDEKNYVLRHRTSIGGPSVVAATSRGAHA